jgi:hypothetical protein
LIKRPVRQAAQHFFKRNLAFDTGKRSAETEVGGPSKGEMAIVLTRYVEAIRVGETFGIAIAGSHDSDGCLSLQDSFTPEVEFAGR